MNSCKKGAKNLPPSTPPPHARADRGRKIKVAGLLGQRFLEQIQNSGRRYLSVSGEEGHSIKFIGSVTFVGLN